MMSLQCSFHPSRYIYVLKTTGAKLKRKLAKLRNVIFVWTIYKKGLRLDKNLTLDFLEI